MIPLLAAWWVTHLGQGTQCTSSLVLDQYWDTSAHTHYLGCLAGGGISYSPCLSTIYRIW